MDEVKEISFKVGLSAVSLEDLHVSQGGEEHRALRHDCEINSNTDYVIKCFVINSKILAWPPFRTSR